ncbi:WD40/YVTN/BNR-like repeat-containing protein [Microbulbifer sp. EKSA005]|uniref:WD40/YVTN/BNR-like repeat-containing protein n=1 Tax=Microbulbifer sp. EKSA005 TaxID=3243364 RepID=UPI0040414CBA
MSGMNPLRYVKSCPLLLAVCLLFLQGCAGQVNMLPTLKEDVPISEQDGIVVARIINASGVALPFNQLTINPENLNESKSIKPERLLADRPKLNGTTVFASSVKPGNYSISSIRAFYSNGNGWYSRFVSADEKLGTFSVTQGEVTDLGTLIYYPKPQGDRYLDLLIRAPESKEGEVIAKHFPFIKYDPQSINGWHIDENDEERESAYISIAQNPLTYSEEYISPDNSIYFLGKVGVFMKRTPDGDWELDAVDTNHELTAIAQNNHGDLVVGGSEGALFWRSAKGDWLDISLEHNTHIENLRLLDTGEIELLVTRDFEVNIYRGVVANSQVKWKLLNQYSSRSGQGWKHIAEVKIGEMKAHTKSDQHIYNTTIFEFNGQNYITVREQSTYGSIIFSPINSEIFIYDPESWMIEKTVDDFDLNAIVNAGAVQLGVEEAGFWSWTGKPTYYKIDKNGNQDKITTYIKECKESKSSRNRCINRNFTFRSVPWFSTDNEAVAIVGFSQSNFSGRNRETETRILTTTDGGKSWISTDNKPPTDYCTSIVPLVADRLLVSCDGANGDFYESTDLGASWNQVRQQDNF